MGSNYCRATASLRGVPLLDIGKLLCEVPGVALQGLIMLRYEDLRVDHDPVVSMLHGMPLAIFLHQAAVLLDFRGAYERDKNPFFQQRGGKFLPAASIQCHQDGIDRLLNM